MKKFFSSLIFMFVAGACFAQEVIVTPSHMNGWSCSTFAPNGKPTTTGWYLGYRPPAPQLGRGDLWLYTGNSDGIAYAENTTYKGVLLSSVAQLSYSTFTAFGLMNVAPSMNLFIDTDEDGVGDTWLEYSPALNGVVPRGRWTNWNVLQGKWWNNKYGGKDMRPITDWLAIYPKATLNTIRIQAGTWSKDGADPWRNSWLGVDLPTIAVGSQKPVQYNFEPDDAVAPKVLPPTIVTTIINAMVIEYPVYYIEKGQPVGEKPKPEAKPESKPKLPEEYKAEGAYYVPLLFDGNITLNHIFAEKDDYYEPLEKLGDEQKKFFKGGSFLLGGVPFVIPKDKDNVWAAREFGDEKSHQLEIKTNLTDVLEVCTIMNTMSASTDKGLLSVEFRGSKGAFYRAELTSGKDVRDWKKYLINDIAAPTKAVWMFGVARLDCQTFKLPKEFIGQDLQTVTIVDKGGQAKQRVFVVGVTAKVKADKM